MKSIRLIVRALKLDGKTLLPSNARITYDQNSESYQVVGTSGGALAKFGVLRAQDLVAQKVIGAADHVLVRRVGVAGNAGAVSLSGRSRHVAFGQRVDTSATRSSEGGEIGPFALGPTDELELTSSASSEQVVTLALLIGTAEQVERLRGQELDADLLTSHAVSHQNGGVDELDVTGLSGVLADAQLAQSHASTHLSGGSDPIAAATTSSAGIVELAMSTEIAAGLAVQASDSRLSDSRTPLAHASTHKSGGTDEIKLDELGAPTDITTNNATSSRHGLLPKLSGVSGQYLNGSGAWVSPEPTRFLSVDWAYTNGSRTRYTTSQLSYVACPVDVDRVLIWHLAIPPGASTTVGYSVVFTGDTVNSGNVYFTRHIRRFYSGSSASSLATTQTSWAVAYNGVYHIQQFETIASQSLDSAQAGEIVTVYLGVDRSNTADTYTGEVRVFGVLIEW